MTYKMTPEALILASDSILGSLLVMLVDKRVLAPEEAVDLLERAAEAHADPQAKRNNRLAATHMRNLAAAFREPA